MRLIKIDFDKVRSFKSPTTNFVVANLGSYSRNSKLSMHVFSLDFKRTALELDKGANIKLSVPLVRLVRSLL
jgi:hypothetical protein